MSHHHDNWLNERREDQRAVAVKEFGALSPAAAEFLVRSLHEVVQNAGTARVLVLEVLKLAGFPIPVELGG